MNATNLRTQLRALLASDACVYCPAVFDPLSARMAGDLGFGVGILGGSVASLQLLAAPDINLLTLTELTQQCQRICRVQALPLIADADHGYGNALNVMRTVQELEAAGVAAISLEDTLIPRAFGGPAPQLIALDEMVGRLNAAVAAREDESLVLIARTHAGEVGTGPDRDADIAMRLRAYAGAGADMLCLTGVQSLAQFETLAQVAQGLNKPLLLISYAGTAVARGLSDLALLARHGVRLLVDGHAPYFAGLQATYAALKALREGINAAHLPGLPAPELVARLSRRAEHEAWASEFLDKA